MQLPHVHIKPFCDAAAVGTAIGALFGYLPQLAAGASFLYTIVSLWFLLRAKWFRKHKRTRKYDTL